jgi:hypothetical protein
MHASLSTRWTGRFGQLALAKTDGDADLADESGQELDPEPLDPDSEEEADSVDLQAALLARRHALTPRGSKRLLKATRWGAPSPPGDPMTTTAPPAPASPCAP